MKENKLSIIIDKPARVIFDYTLNPKNTPRWIDGIEVEETNDWPVRVGSTYRNRGSNGTWNEYTLTELVNGQAFTLKSKPDGNLSVRYTFAKLSDNSTQLNYHEWVDQPPLTHAFTQEALEKLKSILESN